MYSYYLLQYHMAGKFRGRKFRDFAQNQTSFDFNFAILTSRTSPWQANYLAEGRFRAPTSKIALKWLTPLLRYAAAILLWRLHIIIMRVEKIREGKIREFGQIANIKPREIYPLYGNNNNNNMKYEYSQWIHVQRSFVNDSYHINGESGIITTEVHCCVVYWC